MPVKRGLGKGLDSLITPKISASSAAHAAADSAGDDIRSEDGVVYVDIGEVEPNRTQPRKHFSEEALRELADSIEQHGILQPLLVRRREDYYEIIAGERRWRAAKLAKQKTVPVLIRDVTDREQNEMALIENLQREDLDPIEEAAAYQRLIKEYGLKQEEVAQRVSKSRTAVTNSMRLLKLDERVQEMLIQNQISAGHARALLSVKEKDSQFEIAKQIAKKGLSVRDTEKLAQKKKETGKSAGSRKDPQPEDPHKDEQRNAIYRKIEGILREKIGTKVEIVDAGGKGKIEISYFSEEELDRIVEALCCVDQQQAGS